MKNGTIIPVFYYRHIYSINPDGTQRARYRTNDAILSSPEVMDDGLAVIGSENGKIYFLRLTDNPNSSFNSLVQVDCTKEKELGGQHELRRLVAQGYQFYTRVESNAHSARPTVTHRRR
jgi:hypothetical protein